MMSERRGSTFLRLGFMGRTLTQSDKVSSWVTSCAEGFSALISITHRVHELLSPPPPPRGKYHHLFEKERGVNTIVWPRPQTIASQSSCDGLSRSSEKAAEEKAELISRLNSYMIKISQIKETPRVKTE